MTAPTFAPSVNPSYEVPTRHRPRVDTTRTIKGYDLVRVHGVRFGVGMSLGWRSISKTVLDEILSFFEALNGSVGPFYWVPLDKVRSPLGVSPALSSVAGGSLTSQGTYYVQFTWANSTESQESLPSKEASLAVADNNLLVVTLPVFPVGADRANIYVGQSSGAEDEQGYTESRTWTMPTGGIIVGDAVPTASDLKPPLLWRLAAEPEETKISAGRYNLALQFERQVAE